jgi:hypothetical protein
LQGQIDRREKLVSSLEEDLNRQRDRVSDLLKNIDQLQSQVSEKEMLARRTDRELKDEREKALRLEREVEGWKGLRFDRGSVKGGTGTLRVASSQFGSIRGRRDGSLALGSVSGSVSGFLRGVSPAPSSVALPASRPYADKQPSVEPELAEGASEISVSSVVARPLRRVSNTKGFL